jgi:O-antigen ligase
MSPQIASLRTNGIERSTARVIYPVRYWLLVAYTVGIPMFIRFDSTGRTHEFGLFNAFSISTIGLRLFVLFLFVVLSALSRQPIIARPVRFGAPLWVGLCVLFVIASWEEPTFRLTPTNATDLFLSFYRLLEWIIAFLLFLSLYSRVSDASMLDFVSGLVARVCWIWIAIVWIVLPFAPSFAYGLSSEDADTPRLGGALIHPVALGVMAAIAGLHAIVFLRGTRRVAAFTASVLTIVLTYARGAEATMLASLFVYSLFFTRGFIRWIGAIAGILSVGSGLVFSASIERYAGRGNGIQDVTTFSGRLQVWTVAVEAIRMRPWIGYGFIAGAKNVLKDHWTYSYWLPPHAHNDLIQAVLEGGILAGVIVFALYIYAFRSAFQILTFDRRNAFVFLTLVQLASASVLGTLVSGQFVPFSGLFIYCSVFMVDRARMHKTMRNMSY